MLEHGGRLRAAAAQFGIPLGDWVDLSTGINPHPYPVPPLPAAAWHRLPEDGDGLEAAAAAYYGSAELLPVAGSQAAIQTLPHLLDGRRVALLQPGYAEHAHAWRDRRVQHCRDAADIDAAVERSDIVLLIHPNNPTGQCFERDRLHDWHDRLARRGGWLVVDEAFLDCAPDASLVPRAGADGLVVLRSLGKFFGLAGARVGFVFAPRALRDALAERLGPWAVSGPSRHAAAVALADTAWQAATRRQLAQDGERLQALLTAHGLADSRGPALFKWLRHPHATVLQQALARRAILVRRFDAPASLRFGLPATENEWQRLDSALSHLPDLVRQR